MLSASQQRLQHSARMALQALQSDVAYRDRGWYDLVHRALQVQHDRCQRAELRLGLLDPSLVLQRGYAWLTLENGQTLCSVAQAAEGEHVRATLVDGTVDLTIRS